VARKSPPRSEQGQSSSRSGSSSGGGSGPRRGGPGGRRGERIRPRKYTKINAETIDYKDLTLLRRFLSDRGKVRSRRVTGLSRQHQRELALAVKRARELGMLPYVGER
jgi:small subunit ribosomal protein S18